MLRTGVARAHELGCCHNFTTVWIQPNGSTYKTYSGSFPDYKDTNVTWNYWKSNYTQDDYLFINPSTPVGNWKVEVYLDRYHFNNTWMRYGPIATTPFIIAYVPTIEGDINGDGIVTINDVVIAALAFGSAAEDDPSTPWNETRNWNPDADLNNDGKVNIIDLVTIGVNFGKRLPL